MKSTAPGSPKGFSERVYGRSRRTFPVPDDADLGEVGAVRRDGVPKIDIPKLARKRPRAEPISIHRG